MIKNSLKVLTDEELNNLFILKSRRHGSVGERLAMEILMRSMTRPEQVLTEIAKKTN